MTKKNNEKRPPWRPEEWTYERSMALAKRLIIWLLPNKEDISQGRKDSHKKNLFFERFLYLEAKLCPQTISELSHKFSDFSEAVKYAKKIQELKLRELGCFRKIESKMAIFCLINNHDYYNSERLDHKIDKKENVFQGAKIMIVDATSEKKARKGKKGKK